MATSLAQILERKRQEELASRQKTLQTVAEGQFRGRQTAGKITEAKRAREAEAFSPESAALAGATGFALSGGNPLAAGLAALSAPRGKKFKPLETVGAGLGAGISVGALGAGADVGKTVQALSKIENIEKTLPILKQAGAPKEVTSSLEAFSKTQQKKAAQAEKTALEQAELKSKREFEREKLETERKTGLEKIKAQQETARLKERGARETKMELQKRKEKADIAAAKTKTAAAAAKETRKQEATNRRAALKEFNIQLSELEGNKKRRTFQENKKAFLNEYIQAIEKGPESLPDAPEVTPEKGFLENLGSFLKEKFSDTKFSGKKRTDKKVAAAPKEVAAPKEAVRTVSINPSKTAVKLSDGSIISVEEAKRRGLRWQ